MGWPAKRTGMVKTAFRASDDAAKFPFNIPENALAVVALRGLAPLLSAVARHPPPDCTPSGTEASCQSHLDQMAQRALALADEIDTGIKRHGIVRRPGEEEILAYEVDGHGNAYVMDDANIPSLLSLPYLGYINESEPLYLATRRAGARATALPSAWPFGGVGFPCANVSGFVHLRI
jgi:meiotically up-regulated gene 157 (Mug157) protein